MTAKKKQSKTNNKQETETRLNINSHSNHIKSLRSRLMLFVLNNFKFFFLKRHMLVSFLFLSDGGTPNVSGSGITYPPLPSLFSTGLLLLFMLSVAAVSELVSSRSCSVCCSRRLRRLSLWSAQLGASRGRHGNERCICPARSCPARLT